MSFSITHLIIPNWKPKITNESALRAIDNDIVKIEIAMLLIDHYGDPTTGKPANREENEPYQTLKRTKQALEDFSANFDGEGDILDYRNDVSISEIINLAEAYIKKFE